MPREFTPVEIEHCVGFTGEPMHLAFDFEAGVEL